MHVYRPLLEDYTHEIDIHIEIIEINSRNNRECRHIYPLLQVYAGQFFYSYYLGFTENNGVKLTS